MGALAIPSVNCVEVSSVKGVAPTNGRVLPIYAVFPMNGPFHSTSDINSRLPQFYHGLVGTHDVEIIM